MRILIVRVSALGDAIHTLPALDILKKNLPNAHIDWLIQKKISPIVAHIPGINTIYTLHNNYLSPSSIAHTYRLLTLLRNNKYDLVIDFQGLCKTSILLLGIDAPSIGFGWHSAREAVSSTALRYTISLEQNTNIIEKNKKLAYAALSLLKINIKANSDQENKPLLSAPQASVESHDRISSWLKNNTSKRLIIVTPNTTWDSKHWPLCRWEELLTKLESIQTHTIVFVGQNFGIQGSKLATFIQNNNLSILIAPGWILEDLFAVMNYTDVLVAPDTGLLHIADCLGVPTVGLYGPTKIFKHGPQITPHNLDLCLQANCTHDYQKHHTNNNQPNSQDCMLSISADMVLSKITLALNLSMKNP